MTQVFDLLDEATKTSLRVVEALRGDHLFEVNAVREAMDSRSEVLTRLEGFVASEKWAFEKQEVDTRMLREKFDELMKFDEQIRDYLKHRASEHENSREEVKRELNAQNSYSRAGQRQNNSFFIDNKLHG